MIQRLTRYVLTEKTKRTTNRGESQKSLTLFQNSKPQNMILQSDQAKKERHQLETKKKSVYAILEIQRNLLIMRSFRTTI